MDAVPWIKPQYLWEDTDRHGNIRRYVKKGTAAKIRVRPDPYEAADEFWKAYSLALEGKIYKPPDAAPAPPEPGAPGTFRWLMERWLASPEAHQLNARTRRVRRLILESCCAEPLKPGSDVLFGSMPIGRIGTAAVRMLRDRKMAVPDGANNRLKALRAVFKWALEQEDLCRLYGFAGNPARDVSRLKPKNTEGFHTWTLEEVAQFEKRHPPETKARLALSLFLYTGQRKSDVVGFGRQHLRRKIDEETGRRVTKLVFTQVKNAERKPVTLELPVLDVLEAAIKEAPAGNLTFLVTSYGRPFTANGFGNKFRDWCDEAGLHHCSAHGLRKAGACFAALNGATDAQMMAIFGWRDPAMPAKYRRMASQMKMAAASMHTLVPRRGRAAADAPLLDWAAKEWEDLPEPPREAEG